MAIEDEVLAKLSNQVLAHIKELGLFDEMRMKLFNDLEASKEFGQIKEKFGDEIEQFCRKKANQMNLPRTKLREQLNREQQHRFKSTCLLELNVRRLFRKHQNELKSLYNKQANDFLLGLQRQHQITAVVATGTATTTTTSSKQHQRRHRAPAQTAPQLAENHNKKQMNGKTKSAIEFN